VGAREMFVCVRAHVGRVHFVWGFTLSFPVLLFHSNFSCRFVNFSLASSVFFFFFLFLNVYFSPAGSA